MILDSIVVENIRSYAHEEVEFSTGTSLLEGDIGSGKSTILMAIEFALFGLGAQKSESLLSKKESAGYVVLRFMVGGHSYEVKRALKKTTHGTNQNPKDSWFKQDGVHEPLSPSEIKQRVLEILGFNESADPKTESRIFRYAVFTPQEEMKKVLSNEKDRLETIRKAFQIEEYSTAWENAKLLSSDIRTRMVVMAARFGSIPELESMISEVEDEIDAADAKIQEGRERQKNIDGRIDAADAELNELRKKDSARIRLQSEIDGLKGKISERTNMVKWIKNGIEESKKELEELDADYDEKAKTKAPDTKMTSYELTDEIKKFQKISEARVQTETKLKSVKTDLADIRVELGDMDTSLESANGMLESMQEKKKTYDAQEEKIRAGLDSARSQKTRMQTKKEGLEDEIGRFATLGSRCPMCDQDIDEKHNHAMVDDKKAAVLELDRELAQTDSTISRLTTGLAENVELLRVCEDKIPHIRESINDVKWRDELQSDIPKLEKEISGFDCQYSEFPGGNPIEVLGKLKDDVASYEQVGYDMERIEISRRKVRNYIQRNLEDMESAKSQILDWQAELALHESKFAAMEDVAGTITKTEETLESLRAELASAVHDITVAETTAVNKEENAERYRAQLAESKKLKARHGWLSQMHEWVDKFFMPAVEEIEKQVLLDILQRFNTKYREWYSVLVDDPTKESRIDENFTPVVEQDGYEQKVDFLSGGEKTSIALAYRLTLNSLVRDADSIKSNLLILDEPTDGFSQDQLAKVQEILDTIDSEQIILVSHDRELENCADHVFHISKHDGMSRVQKASVG